MITSRQRFANATTKVTRVNGMLLFEKVDFMVNLPEEKSQSFPDTHTFVQRSGVQWHFTSRSDGTHMTTHTSK